MQLNAPYSYFKNFITDEFLDLIVQQTNLYSAQQNVNKPLNVTKNEIEQWLGLVMYFSIFKISDTRMHWSRSVAEFMNVAPYVMSRDRFESIKKNFHLVDNNNITSQEDKMFKVRPMIDQLREKFNEIKMPQELCVDEQLVPFKGRSQVKQYIPSKPYKWDIKYIYSLMLKGSFMNPSLIQAKSSLWKTQMFQI